MKKIFTVILLLSVIGVCAQKNKTFEDITKCQPEDTTKIGICHQKQGSALFVYKLIPKESLEGHLAHGDFMYKGRPDVTLWEMNDWCMLNIPTNIDKP